MNSLRKPFATLALFLPMLAWGATDIELRISGRETVVFSWQRDRCANDQLPDSPVRAFRTADGEVRLIAAHYTNRFMAGKSLDTVRVECRLSYVAAMDPDPERFDARTWLQTFYTEDGRNVYSLASADYHGVWFGRCAGNNPSNAKCWRSAIVLARSSDGGKSFTTAAASKHIVARPPFAFAPDALGRPQGFFTTSNIVKRDGHYYALVYTFGFSGQAAGNCLMRTADLADAASWRAWDGKGFSVPLFERHDSSAPGQTVHECATVPMLREPVRTLLWHEATRQFVAIFSAATRRTEGSSRRVQVNFRYTLSQDLLQWSTARTFLSESSALCHDVAVPPVSYPSIIDPGSRDRNFGTLATGGYLYFTRYNSASQCKMTMDRDLVRVRLQVVLAGPSGGAGVAR